jgi:hypothetical protein
MKEKDEPKSVLLQVRIPRELRDDFIRTVRGQDDNASRLIRHWIREYLHEPTQPDLFEHY